MGSTRGEVVTARGDSPALGQAEVELGNTLRAPRPSDSVTAQQSVESLFDVLVAEWRQSITPTTTLTSLLAHPAYNRIVGMGLLASSAVVPLILRDLSTHPRQWFQALQEITGEDPVPAEATTFDEYRQAWLSWGRDRKLL